MNLSEFLLARIDEDHRTAVVEASLRNDDPYWTSGESSKWERRVTPERLLAECEAKRRIVNMHGWTKAAYVGDEPHICCEMCGTPLDSPEPWPCETLRALALPYADHPDYDQAWRP